MGTGWILVWAVLVVLPPLALAGSQPRRGVPPLREATPARQPTTTDLDTLLRRVQAAQASNDPAQMRAVLDDVQRPLAAMQDSMAGCQQIMRQGHGRMGGH
jgi:hypothetical protein